MVSPFDILGRLSKAEMEKKHPMFVNTAAPSQAQQDPQDEEETKRSQDNQGAAGNINRIEALEKASNEK